MECVPILSYVAELDGEEAGKGDICCDHTADT